MKLSCFKKCIAINIIILLIGLGIIQTINGNTLKTTNLEDKITKRDNSNIDSYINIGHIENFIKKNYSQHIIRDRNGCIYQPDAINSINNPPFKTNYQQNNEYYNFKLKDYKYLNPDPDHDQYDNLQILEFSNIEQQYRDVTDKNILSIKNKIFSKNSNPNIIYKSQIETIITNSGNIFYVGGSGSDNYSTIQDAVDSADNGDTVFVYDDSSPYYENVLIDKSINLIGENKDTTIINGSRLDQSLHNVNVTANNVNIHGFTINNNDGEYYHAGIMIFGDYTTVSNCIIHDNFWIGISLIDASFCQIFDCELYDNLMAIHLVDSNSNDIRNCLCYDNGDAIMLFTTSHYNQIMNCTCIRNGFNAIHIQHSIGNKILNCTCKYGGEGIGLANTPNTIMRGNILVDNYENFGIGSTSLSNFYCDIDTSNTINDKPIYYWIDHHNQQIPSDAAFIGLISCSNITVNDFTISNNFQGILCAGTSKSTIKNCNFYDNSGHGVYLVSSSNNTIINCSCKNSFFSGIFLNILSNSNNISNNTFSNIKVTSIWVEESPDNYISNHAISNCVRGISLDKSGNSILRHNDMVNCGLIVDGTILSDYINDVDTSNTVNGKKLYYYINENDITVPSNAGQVILVNSTNCNVSNLDLSEGTIGVELAYSSYNVISKNIINGNNVVAIDLDLSNNNYNIVKDNTIHNNNYGIDIDISNYNTISFNSIYSNGVGISLDTSDSNVIKENDIQDSQNGIYIYKSCKNNINSNTISDCDFTSIYLLYSKDNILKDNNQLNCGLIVYGVSLSEYINDVDASNIVNGKKLYYYIKENDITVPSDAGQIILVNCENCIVSNLDLSEGTMGLELAYSNYNTISANSLNNNKFAGIYLESSDNNNVKSNTIKSNSYGVDLQLAYSNHIEKNNIQENYYGCFIYLSDSNSFTKNTIQSNYYGIAFNLPSDSNNIHLNNLIYNGLNAKDENKNTNIWDDGKKGNYWEDYKQKYPKAKKMWLRGIWDTPYEIYGEKNQDRYPLILPNINFKDKTVELKQIKFLYNFINLFPIIRYLLQLSQLYSF